MLKKLCLRLSSRSKRGYTLSLPKGFTLIEVMIVVAIIAVLLLALLTSFTKQRIKAEDARIKADLERLRIAFEEYYNDNNCYPPVEWFDDSTDCGSENLKPYLNVIPCNPKTALPYVLEYPDTQCSSFKLYSTLANLDDPSLLEFCVPSGGSTKGNYGVSSTNVTVTTNCSGLSTPTPIPTPTPNPTPGIYGCQVPGVCASYGTAENAALNCPITFIDRIECENYCPTHYLDLGPCN